MVLKELKERTFSNKKMEKKYIQLNSLIIELISKELTNEVIESINLHIELLNNFSETNKEFNRLINKSLGIILKILREKLKIVPKNYYVGVWTALGLAVFGVPIGIAFGTALGNMAFMGVGIGMGLPIGIAIGVSMDTKAQKEGRQLLFEEKL